MDNPGRFAASIIDKIRDKAELPVLVGRSVKLRKVGRRFVGKCPFHGEKTPSFYVDPARNTYRCYGCAASGDAIEWVMKQQHLSFPEAVRSLASLVGVELPAGGAETNNVESVERRKRLSRFYRALERAQAVYVSGLIKMPASRAYLESRKISEDSIAVFQLGAVASGVLHHIRGFTTEELVGSGLASVSETDGNLFDRFRNRIVFPIHNARGNLVGFAGRSLIERPERVPKYLNSPDTELFDKSRELYGLFQARKAIRENRVAVVVEGYFDVIRAHQHGDKRVVGTMGTAVSEMQLRKLFREADVVIFAFDGDKAGRKAALRGAAVLLSVLRDGQQAKFLFLPSGEDPDSFIDKNGIEAWCRALAEATPLSHYLCTYVAHRLDQSLPESQVAAVGRAKAVLARVESALVFRLALRMRFEEIIGVPLE